MRDYTVVYNGKGLYQLNARMAERQCITDAQLCKLKQLHTDKLNTFEYMGDYNAHLLDAIDMPEGQDRNGDIAYYSDQLRAAALHVEYLEFEMQDCWNFPRDAGMHEWYRVPGCTCPKADNEDRRYPGSTIRVISLSCPIHSSQQCPPIIED